MVWVGTQGSRLRQGASWQWVLGPQDVPSPRSPRARRDGSARAAPPGRLLGGGAFPPEPPAPRGLSHAPAPPRRHCAGSGQVRPSASPSPPHLGQWAPRTPVPSRPFHARPGCTEAAFSESGTASRPRRRPNKAHLSQTGQRGHCPATRP